MQTEAMPPQALVHPEENPGEKQHVYVDDDFDEFDDDDALSDNAWAQAALLAEQQTQISQNQGPLPVPEVIHVESSPAAGDHYPGVLSIKEPSSDEFGDDIGMDDFAVAEALATQAFGAGTVCLR
jgi:hypothetical protein